MGLHTLVMFEGGFAPVQTIISVRGPVENPRCCFKQVGPRPHGTGKPPESTGSFALSRPGPHTLVMFEGGFAGPFRP